MPPMVDAAAPLTALPGLDLAWPDFTPAAPLALPAATAPALPPVATPELPGSGALASGERQRDTLAGGRVELSWPAGIPDRPAIEARYRLLGALPAAPPRPGESLTQLGVRATSDRNLLERLLKLDGYYDAGVSQTLAPLDPAAPAGPPGVRFGINPGVEYKYALVDLPGLSTAPDTAALRQVFGIHKGDPVNSDTIAAQASRLAAALAESGYAFAKLDAPQLTIDHETTAATLDLPLTTGAKYQFGAITSNHPRLLSPRHLARLARFRPGETYAESAVTDLRKAVLATGLVSSLAVTPRDAGPATNTAAQTPAPPAAPSRVADLDVAFTPAPPRTLSGAIGYDTAEGARLELGWEHRNLFPPEGSLRLRGVVGTDEQLAGVTFRRNNIGGRDQILTIDLYAQNADLTAFAARKVSFATTFERLTTALFQKPWSWSVGAVAEASEEREGAPLGAAVITCPTGATCLPGRALYVTGAAPLRAAYDGSDSLLDPHHGWRAALRVSPEISFTAGKTAPYVHIEGDLSAYQPLAPGVVLAARTRIGSIMGVPLAQIAPSRRFYAGGGGSIRGFGYDLVGPRNLYGEPTGGRSVYEVSGEVRVKTGLFGGGFSFAPFLDTGSAGTSARPDFSGLRLGAGMGLRYDSSIGPIRLDIGTPLDPHPGDSRIGVYVSLGQAF